MKLKTITIAALISATLLAACQPGSVSYSCETRTKSMTAVADGATRTTSVTTCGSSAQGVPAL